MPFSHGSGSASGSGLRPDPRKPIPNGNDRAQGASHPNDLLDLAIAADFAAGPAVTTMAAASRGNRVSQAEVDSAVPYLARQLEWLRRHAGRAAGAGARVPRLAPGVEQLGEYQGSGLTDATYLVRTPGGQVVHLSRLLHLVLSGIDGSRTVNEIAARVTAAFGRTVSGDNVGYLLANKLAPLGLIADEGPRQAAAGQAQAILALKLHRTLVSAAGVQKIARLFRPLFNPVVVVATLIGLVASDVWLVRGGRLGSALVDVLLNPPLLLMVLGLSVLSMMFHECGHAAACRYGGARPGVIGMGFYVIWPAFFTNVTDTYRLGRAGRIRTDLGGVYFNAIFALTLAAAYLATGYSPLVAAILLVHMEIVQQLLPSLRFDGYFILTDLIGVPDLFRRIGPTVRSMVPGRSGDPRVQGLKRGARVTLTAWVLIIVPLLGAQLALIVLDGPRLIRTFVRSLDTQLHDVLAQFGRTDVAAGLVSAISVVLLVLPMAGLCYILLSTGRRALRSLIAVNRRHPVLWLPSIGVVLLVAATLAVHWGFVSIGRGVIAPRPAGAAAGRRHLPRPASAQSVRPAHGAGPAAVVLTPVSAWSDENDSLAGYAIDGNPATAWQTQYYLGNPVFGGVKTAVGLILDMGRQIRLRSVTVTFGPTPGADVSIRVGNDDTLAASTPSTVATARDVGGRYTFECRGAARGRYVLIWLTKLPSAGSGQFHAEIFNIVVRGWA